MPIYLSLSISIYLYISLSIYGTPNRNGIPWNTDLPKNYRKIFERIP